MKKKNRHLKRKKLQRQSLNQYFTIDIIRAKDLKRKWKMATVTCKKTLKPSHQED